MMFDTTHHGRNATARRTRFMRARHSSLVSATGVLVVGLVFSGCAMWGTLFGHVGVKKPTVRFTNVELVDVAFEQVNLLFSMAVTNPNRMGLHLVGFDYNLLVNGSPLVRGTHQQAIELAGRSRSVVQLPVTVRYDDVYRVYASLKEADTTAYQLVCGVVFRVPLLGNVRVPLRQEGTFPLIKRPSVRIEALRVKRMTLSGAELGLLLHVTNPNAFSALIERVHYAFKVDGKTWASGSQTEPAPIGAKSAGTVELGVRLNFLQIGAAVSRSLLDRKPLSYELEGGLDLQTSLPMFERASLPFHLTGEIKPTD